jgi:hypothetical protein
MVLPPAPRGNCGSGKRGKIQLDIFSVFIWSGFVDKILSKNLGCIVNSISSCLLAMHYFLALAKTA